MSIEDVRRVNELVQNLLNKGLASSREDAIRQAESILNKKIVEPIPGKNTVEVKNDLEMYKNIIERSREYTEKQLKGFKQELELLAKEIAVLRQEIVQLKLKGRSVVESSSSDKKTEEVQRKFPEKSGESHPKRGNFKSEDVSVEKIFYFGNK